MFASLLTFMLSGKAYAAADTSDAEIPAEVFEPVAAAVDGVPASDVPNPPAEKSPDNDADGTDDSSDLSVSSAADDASQSDSDQNGAASSDLSFDSSDPDTSDSDNTMDVHDDSDDSHDTENGSLQEPGVTLPDVAAGAVSSDDDVPAEPVTDDDSDIILSTADDNTQLNDEDDAAEGVVIQNNSTTVKYSFLAGAYSAGSQSREVRNADNSDPDSETAGSDTEQNTSVLVVGEEVIDLENGGSGEGWSYSAEYDSVILRDYDESESLIGTAGKDLTITATGVNRVGTLVVDGDLNIIGSGILLIDSIEMAEGTSFNLQTNTDIYPDKTGSVAVFLKQEDGTYLLINGDPNDSENPGIAAILDGDCTLPENVTLVLPDHSQMILQSVSSRDGQYSTTEILGAFDGAMWEPDVKATSPKLIIPESSNLVVCSGAVLEFHPISGEQYVTDYGNPIAIDKIRKDVTYAPSIVIEGGLELNCDEVSNAVLTFGKNSSFSGSGTISNSTVRISENITDPLSALYINNSTVILDGNNADLNTLHIAGSDSVLIIRGDCEIGTISMESDSKLTCRDSSGYGFSHTLTVAESLEAESFTVTLPSTQLPGGIDFGGQTMTFPGHATVVLQSGIYQMYHTDTNVTITSRWNLNDTLSSYYHVVSPTIGGAALFDYTDNAREPGELPLVESGAGSITSPFIPVYDGNVFSLKEADGSIYTVFQEEPKSKALLRMNNGSVTKDWLKESLGLNGSSIVVETVDENGRYDLILLHDDMSLPMTIIKRIYAVDLNDGSHAQGGGGFSTSTHTNYTGTGVLGGQGAGSIQGGSESTVFSGSGITTSILPGGNDDPSDPGNDDPDDPSDPGNGDDVNDDTDLTEQDEQDNGSVSDAEQSANVWVEEQGGAVYVLCAKDGEKTLKDLGGHVKVRMPYTPPSGTNGKSLYAVFRGNDGKLRAFKASAHILKGELTFTADCLGRFIVVSFEFDGEEFSEAFYDALEQLINGLI